MVLQNHQISPQYLNKNQLTVTLLKVINPVHFVVKESPSLDGSFEAKNFIEAEEAMQKYYESVEPCFFQLPLKDTIIVAFVKDKFYRAKVIRILTLSAGHLVKVYLVDYGLEFSVPRECIYEIAKDFLGHPFQAVNFKLLGIEPTSLIINSENLTMSYGPVSHWDPSAEIFVHNLQKEMCNAYIEIQANDEKHIYGKLFICYRNNITKCVNDELIANKFARFNENCSENVQKVSSPVGIPNSDSGSFGALESLKYEESISTQVSSPSYCPNSELDFDFKMKFVSPSDGRVVAESSFIECSTTKDDLQSELCVKESNLASSPVSEAISEEQPQTVGQLRLLRLQQLHRKQLSSPIRHNNAEIISVKGLPPVIENAVKESSDDVCTEKNDKSSSEVHSRPNEESRDIIVKLNNSDVSSDSNNNSNSFFKSNVSVSAVLEGNLEQETMTEDQLIAHKRFQKLQKLYRKKLKSPNKEDSTMVKSLHTGSENEANITNVSIESSERKSDISPKSLSSDCPKSCQSSTSKNCIEAASENNSKQENTSEVVLEHVKTLQRLQNRVRMKKMKSPLQISNEASDVNNFSTSRDHQSSSSSSSSSSSGQICSEPSTERSQVRPGHRVPVISSGFKPRSTPLFVPQ